MAGPGAVLAGPRANGNENATHTNEKANATHAKETENATQVKEKADNARENPTASAKMTLVTTAVGRSRIIQIYPAVLRYSIEL